MQGCRAGWSWPDPNPTHAKQHGSGYGSDLIKYTLKFAFFLNLILIMFFVDKYCKRCRDRIRITPWKKKLFTHRFGVIREAAKRVPCLVTRLLRGGGVWAWSLRKKNFFEVYLTWRSLPQLWATPTAATSSPEIWKLPCRQLQSFRAGFILTGSMSLQKKNLVRDRIRQKDHSK